MHSLWVFLFDFAATIHPIVCKTRSLTHSTLNFVSRQGGEGAREMQELAAIQLCQRP